MKAYGQKLGDILEAATIVEGLSPRQSNRRSRQIDADKAPFFKNLPHRRLSDVIGG
jgi:hypothetical protein